MEMYSTLLPDVTDYEQYHTLHLLSQESQTAVWCLLQKEEAAEGEKREDSEGEEPLQGHHRS